MTNINHLLTKLRDAGDRADYKPDLYDEAANEIVKVVAKYAKSQDALRWALPFVKNDERVDAIVREALKEKS
jgi:septum formation topological specificity factor MinE